MWHRGESREHRPAKGVLCQQTVKQGRQCRVTGGDERLERGKPFLLGSRPVCDHRSQDGQDPWVPKPGRHLVCQPEDLDRLVLLQFLVAILPAARHSGAPSCRECRRDLSEHPGTLGRRGGRHGGHEGLVQPFLGGETTHDEPRDGRHASCRGQAEGPLRIALHHGLQGIPIEKREIVIFGVLGMADESRKPCPPLLQRHSADRRCDEAPHDRRGIALGEREDAIPHALRKDRIARRRQRLAGQLHAPAPHVRIGIRQKRMLIGFAQDASRVHGPRHPQALRAGSGRPEPRGQPSGSGRIQSPCRCPLLEQASRVPHEPVIVMVEQVDERGVVEHRDVLRPLDPAAARADCGHLEDPARVAVVSLHFTAVALVAIVPVDHHDLAVGTVLERDEL